MLVLVCGSIASHVDLHYSIDQSICKIRGDSFIDTIDCRVYYTCKNSQLVYQVCPPGTYFEEGYYGGCKEAEPPGCKYTWKTNTDIPVVTPEPDPKSDCKGQSNGFVYATDGNCRSYAICRQETSQDAECPIGFSYNPKSNICDIANNYLCEEDHMCPPTGIHMFRKLGSCTEYNFCFAGKHLTKTCDNGLNFDTSQNKCATPDVAKCYECPLVDDPQTTITFEGTTSNE